MPDQIFETLQRISQGILFVVVFIAAVALAIETFCNRGMPRIGGKIGRRTADAPAPPVPDGFSRVDCREITNFAAADDAEPYASLRAFAHEAAACAAFMRTEVAPRARAVRASLRWWRRGRAQTPP